MRKQYPHFNITLNKDNVSLYAKIKPTARSICYKIKLEYSLTKRPKLIVVSPELKKNFNNDEIPHTYPGKELCLYYPKFNEFKPTMLVSNHIIPWVTLWLYHYENWHITGVWEGGGEHPTQPKKKRKYAKKK